MSLQYNDLLSGPKGLYYNIIDVPVVSLSKGEAADIGMESQVATMEFVHFAASNPSRVSGLMPMICCPWIGAN